MMVEESALGAVLGALVGDAAGAVLEFAPAAITAADVEHVLTMPGGGIWNVAPGQITDDGELTMSLLNALAESPDRPWLAADHYARWVASDPFDIGITTRNAMGCLRDPALAARAREEGVAAVMTAAARARNQESKANGSLMRATPLGVWGALRSDEALVAATQEDARLSHPNASCVDAAVVYVLAIASLVRAPGDVARAMSLATSWASANANAEVRGWLDDACAGLLVPYSPQDGFVRIALTHAFRHLAAGTSYLDALRETLAGGGDTDTNACIVGGLVGARWGISAIPEPMRAAVLQCDTGSGPHPRPDALHPRNLRARVRALSPQ